ncbi:MAG: 4-hydroxy-tetrahydrodipicolinate reductase [Deltaproteobacteria bacterium]|nr:4-hydroxy-tetrahydrodipicolinate reductase [Deltaproteobacteria bacterium]
MGAETRLVVLGAAGRLGGRILELARETEGVRVAAALEHPRSVSLGKPVPGHDGLTFARDDADVSGGDVLVDVSLPEAVAAHAERAVAAGRPLLVAVTGLSVETRVALDRAAKGIPVCVAPNLSTGVWVLASLVRQAARSLRGFDVEVAEIHHRHKRDAPSGTALLLARHAAEGRGLIPEAVTVNNRSSEPKVRAADSLGVTALRGGDVVGDHTVYLLGDGERLELTHRAHSRDTFARGALRLAPLLKGRAAGLVTVPELLGLQ